MNVDSYEYEDERFDIRNLSHLFNPLRKQGKTPINLGVEAVDKIYSHKVTRTLIGYSKLDSPLKFFFSAWDMIINPEKADENEEHLGVLNFVFTPLVALATLSSLIGKQLYDKGKDHSAYYALYGAFWLIRGPLMALGLLSNAVAVLTLYMTVLTLAATFVAAGAALIVGLSPLIALGAGIFYAVEKAKEEKMLDDSEASHLTQSPI